MALTISTTLTTYAQGAAQDAIQPVADFIAPAVNVPTSVGQYKKYSTKNRFRVPDVRRALGGRATTLQFDAEDGTFNCKPNSIDYPVEMEGVSQAEFDMYYRDGANAVAEIGALAHELKVINAALAAAGGGTAKTWNSAADPIADLDSVILDVLKAAKFGSSMGVGVLFGANAFRIFKNQAAVRGRYVVGNQKNGNVAVPTVDSTGQLLIGNPEVRTTFLVYDSTAEGVAESISFALDTSILIFARKANPTRFDPSFMKTFRLDGRWMVPGTYSRDDGRVQVCKFDWSEDVQVTNSTAVARLVIS